MSHGKIRGISYENIKMPEREAPARIHFFRYVLHNDTD